MDTRLVSFCLRSHNQKDYFREALEGAFAQDYSPLEICIYDDGSTDGSDEMIREMVDEYRRTNGRHEIVYVHGESNVGNIRAAEKMHSLAHGVLCIQNDGDDISLPNRVSRTVEEWVASGCKAKLIHCSGWKFDARGVLGVVEQHSALHPLGACAAYSREVFYAFPPVQMIEAYDDRPYAFRAVILGEEMYIPDRLVLYRVGSGASTSTRTADVVKSITRSLAGVEQSIVDLHGKMDLLGERYNNMILSVEKLKYQFTRYLLWLTGKTVRERWKSRPYTIKEMMGMFKKLHARAAMPIIEMILVLLPFRIGFPVLDLFRAFARFAQGIQYKMTKGRNLPSVDFLKRGDGQNVQHE